MRRDLCESAKKGRVCIDDLCRGNPDNTLCGFDQSFYEEICADMGEDRDPDCDDEEDYDPESPEMGA